MDIVSTVIGTGVTLAGLIVASHWRLSTRLTAVEKETARLRQFRTDAGSRGRSAADHFDSGAVGYSNPAPRAHWYLAPRIATGSSVVYGHDTIPRS